MLALIHYNLVILAVAFLIGLFTGWWAFRRPRSGAGAPDKKAEDSNPS